MLTCFLVTTYFCTVGQSSNWQGKFEQLGKELPTPNEYRLGSGAPGPKYWQQKANYDIHVTLDDINQTITGEETITYFNNSPNALSYLWLQLDQNILDEDSATPKVALDGLHNSQDTKSAAKNFNLHNFKGGLNIEHVLDEDNSALKYVINQTMMRIDLPTPLTSGESVKVKIKWNYHMADRMKLAGRNGYEYFPEDDNYIYAVAQFYPRMAVYDDVNGWQNKQYLGAGEFALTFGDFNVNITVPSDHIIAATGELQNPEKVLSAEQLERYVASKKSFDKPVFIVTKDEAVKNEKSKSNRQVTWTFSAKNVRDFAFASSRKFIWDAQAVKLDSNTPLAMSFYPKESYTLWSKVSTATIRTTLETYSKYTFDYPYPVANSVNSADIGMEYPMICFNYGRTQPDGSYSDWVKFKTINVIIHEIGHNYFPMIVNSDERQWAWMDEGINTFLQNRTRLENYDYFPNMGGTAIEIVDYMKRDPNLLRPIMTNPEQMVSRGYNAYYLPSAALNVLRETVMGPELFDEAFKEYAKRWAFKHPKPADFFRTMEDASAVDLDWFWRGWFFSTEHVDISIDDVKWYRTPSSTVDVENKTKKSKKGDLQRSENNKLLAINDEPLPFNIKPTPRFHYNEFQSRIDDAAIIENLESKNFYEITFTNQGGLISPIVIEFIFDDDTKEQQTIPAEIWRLDENTVKKVFVFDKKVVNVVLDPYFETADTDMTNNLYPRKKAESEFDKFLEKQSEQ
ncbi:M1 family metallopeptidase [Fulvivirga lutea]|uniref:M1 family metallopeptidase n=1 Tax=Fulvivirga lutea TaxID=2810512 RepID=A0A975A2C9_9BACT|nr:M1 family metallopeptidase [Fulvivirga lutea]